MQLASFVDPDKLLADVEKLSFWLDGSGAEMAVVPNGGLPDEIKSLTYVMRALYEVESYRQLKVIHVMVNKLKPGVNVPVHRDFLLPTPLQPRKWPTIERWHLPVTTNDLCYFWAFGEGDKQLPLRFWTGPVPYWKNHQVVNNGKTERIHLVVDLDTAQHLGEYSE